MYVRWRTFFLTRKMDFVIILGKAMPLEVAMDTEYGWQQLYIAAVLESDWSKIEQKIREADDGMRARLYEFSMNHGGTPEENRAIEDALNKLKLLRKDVAAWRGSQQTG
jgi:hypothetical protein